MTHSPHYSSHKNLLFTKNSLHYTTLFTSIHFTLVEVFIVHVLS